jgi:hypothetical protein
MDWWAPNRKQDHTGHRGCLHYQRQMHFPLTVFLMTFTPLSAWWWFPAIFHPAGFQGRKIYLVCTFSKGVSHIYECSLYILYWRMHLQWGMLLCGCSLWNQYGTGYVYICLMQCGVGKSIEGERQPAAAAVCMSTPRSLPMPAARGEKGRFWWFRRGAVCFWEARLQHFSGRGSWADEPNLYSERREISSAIINDQLPQIISARIVILKVK